MSSQKCSQCSASIDMTGLPVSDLVWCGPACHDAYDKAHPEELEGWVAVGDLTAEQRAELDAVLGFHKGDA